MKTLKIYFYTLIIVFFAVTFQSCKSKKVVTKAAPPAETPVQPVAKPTPPPAPAPAPPAPAPVKPDFNFNNVQFDFNSAVLRTDAIQYLDHVIGEMRKDPSAKFKLNGHASSEGTPSHNMVLSVDRANAVKQYLVNAGIDASNLSTKGYGAKKPLVSNKTESGREKNRRVEIKLVH